MDEQEYLELKEKYLHWKTFLIREFDNYETAKADLAYDKNPKKQMLVASYEAVKKVVLELETYGIGITTKTRN